jgi:hypothetical protein
MYRIAWHVEKQLDPTRKILELKNWLSPIVNSDECAQVGPRMLVMWVQRDPTGNRMEKMLEDKWRVGKRKK